MIAAIEPAAFSLGDCLFTQWRIFFFPRCAAAVPSWFTCARTSTSCTTSSSPKQHLNWSECCLFGGEHYITQHQPVCPCLGWSKACSPSSISDVAIWFRELKSISGVITPHGDLIQPVTAQLKKDKTNQFWYISVSLIGSMFSQQSSTFLLARAHCINLVNGF